MRTYTLRSRCGPFGAENVSQLVKQILDLDTEAARKTLSELKDKYPIVLTRDLAKAKEWLTKPSTRD